MSGEEECTVTIWPQVSQPCSVGATSVHNPEQHMGFELVLEYRVCFLSAFKYFYFLS